MTQAEKFPKHVKSENLCLESMRLMVSRWRDGKEAAEEQRKEVGGEKARGGPELWITPACLVN